MSSFEDLASERVEKSNSTDAKRKRKLMPLRNRAIECTLGLPIGDFDPKERIIMACPYVRNEKNPARARSKAPASSTANQGMDVEQALDGSRDRAVVVTQRLNLNRREEPIEPIALPVVAHSNSGRKGKENRERLRTQTRTMVCTYMHRKDVDWVSETVMKLGGWQMELNVSARTTHVICGEEKRTLNLMRGIAYGCWVVHVKWVSQSLEAGQWVPEEPFELKSYPAIHKCRVEREAFGSRNMLFDNGDKYYIAKGTSPSQADLSNLLLLCGARIVRSSKKANVVVSSKAIDLLPGVVQVNEKWVLDSIVQNMLQEKSKYLP